MAGLGAALGMMLGGGLEGVGKAVQDDAIALRDSKLRMLEREQANKMQIDREEADRAFKREEMGKAAPETQTFFDERGSEYKAQWNRETKEWDRVGGTKASPRKAPTVQTFYDENGMEQKSQWNEQTGEWEPIGGSKRSSDGITVTSPDGTQMRIGGGKALTEGQSKDTVFATRASGALPLLDEHGDALTSLGSSLGAKVPGVGNYLKSEEYQKAEQAGMEFLQAILRKDTGAAITADEQTQYGKVYLPAPGDSTAVLEQKRLSRIRAVEALKAGMPAQALLSMEEATRKAAEKATSTGASGRSEAATAAKTGLDDPLGIR